MAMAYLSLSPAFPISEGSSSKIFANPSCISRVVVSCLVMFRYRWMPSPLASYRGISSTMKWLDFCLILL